MTDWTPETNRIQTMHLTADELAALKAAKWGWVASHEFRPDDWRDVEAPNWSDVRIYRAKPAPVTQDVVPWEAITEDWLWSARDKDGRIYLYQGKPGQQSDNWGADGVEYARVEELLVNLTPGTCDWRDSLQQRPQPAAMDAVTEPLWFGTPYWVACEGPSAFAYRTVWVGCETDHQNLKQGLIHLTEASAVAHAKRMTGGV